MQTAERGFEQTVRYSAALDRPGRRVDQGARVRLVLAVAGLAALVGWGVLSHVETDPQADARGVASTQEARLDGHGKWTGYTSP